MIYVLKLENSKYYVGFSNTQESRIQCHFNGGGSSWTRKYKPLELIETMEGSKDTEREITLKYMKLYGWENVRGGGWTAVNLAAPPLCLRIN